MNWLDIYALGICLGAGTIDYHSGGVYFATIEELEGYLEQTGLTRQWARWILAGGVS